MTGRRGVALVGALAVLAGAGAGACAPSAPSTRPSPTSEPPKEPAVPRDPASADRVAVAYAASGGSAGTLARLTVDEAGLQRMFLGSAMSLPPAGSLDRVGSFEGPMSQALRRRLLEALAGLPEEVAAAGAAVPGSVVRNLVVTVNGRARDFAIPGFAPPPLDEVERLLQQAMTELVARPAEAVGAALELGKDGAPTLVVTSVGANPVRLRLTEDGGRVTARGTVAVMSPQGEVYGTQTLTPDVVSGLVASGALPAGTATLAPGTSFRLPFAAPADLPRKGRVEVSGGLELELEVDGQFHRVSVQARPLSLRR